ncbi:MAG TPA: ATP-binding protein [Fimbriimonadaceae bacterium]
MPEKDLLDRLPAALVIFTDDGLITYVNATFTSNFGYEADEVVGRHFEILLTKPSQIFYQTHLFPLLKMQGNLREVYLLAAHKNRAPLPLLINATRTLQEESYQNECLLLSMHRRDEYEEEILQAKRLAEAANQEKELALEALTKAHKTLQCQQEELKERNEELERLKQTLESRVRERTAELEESVQELQRISYSMAHDLRTPIRGVLAVSSLLLQEFGENITAEQMDLLSAQRKHALKLTSLISDLLIFYRLRSRRLAKEEFDISEMARSVIELLKSPSDTHNFQIADGIRVTADPDLADIVLEKLFQNAILYSPSGGPIRFGYCEVDSRQLLCISDEGIGLEDKYAERVLEPLERLHRDEEFPGNGMGLAIAARIIAKHAGALFLKGNTDKGTTVFFSFQE